MEGWLNQENLARRMVDKELDMARAAPGKDVEAHNMADASEATQPISVNGKRSFVFRRSR